jgi:thioredoxin 1
MATLAMNMANFEDTVEGNDIVLIDFWAAWCGPCRRFGPIFEKIAEKNPDLVFAKVDTEAAQDLASTFGIQSIPTLAIFRQKVLVFMQPGALPESALEDLIKQVRALDMDEVRRTVAEQQAAHASA